MTGYTAEQKDFNPRSRKGSDENQGVVFNIPDPISIHAPARGATECGITGKSPEDDFNPRSRKGSDVISIKPIIISRAISIHAPARGATA